MPETSCVPSAGRFPSRRPIAGHGPLGTGPPSPTREAYPTQLLAQIWQGHSHLGHLDRVPQKPSDAVLQGGAGNPRRWSHGRLPTRSGCWLRNCNNRMLCHGRLWLRSPRHRATRKLALFDQDAYTQGLFGNPLDDRRQEGLSIARGHQTRIHRQDDSLRCRFHPYCVATTTYRHFIPTR